MPIFSLGRKQLQWWMSGWEFSKVLALFWWRKKKQTSALSGNQSWVCVCVCVCWFVCLPPCLSCPSECVCVCAGSGLIALTVILGWPWVESQTCYNAEINVRRVGGGLRTPGPGSVELGCALIKHSYWYPLPAWIQSARLDFIASVLWKGIALFTRSHTHTHIHTHTHAHTHTHLSSHICIGHTPPNNRVCGHWGPHRQRSSLGEHRGTSSNGNKKTHTHTHTHRHPSSPRCHVVSGPWWRLARGPSLGWGVVGGGEGELCFKLSSGTLQDLHRNDVWGVLIDPRVCNET